MDRACHGIGCWPFPLPPPTSSKVAGQRGSTPRCEGGGTQARTDVAAVDLQGALPWDGLAELTKEQIQSVVGPVPIRPSEVAGNRRR